MSILSQLKNISEKIPYLTNAVREAETRIHIELYKERLNDVSRQISSPYPNYRGIEANINILEQEIGKYDDLLSLCNSVRKKIYETCIINAERVEKSKNFDKALSILELPKNNAKVFPELTAKARDTEMRIYIELLDDTLDNVHHFSNDTVTKRIKTVWKGSARYTAICDKVEEKCKGKIAALFDEAEKSFEENKPEVAENSIKKARAIYNGTTGLDDFYNNATSSVSAWQALYSLDRKQLPNNFQALADTAKKLGKENPFYIRLTERISMICGDILINANTYTPNPSFKNIQAILSSGQDKLVDETPAENHSPTYGFTRGDDYYCTRRSK